MLQQRWALRFSLVTSAGSPHCRLFGLDTAVESLINGLDVEVAKAEQSETLWI